MAKKSEQTEVEQEVHVTEEAAEQAVAPEITEDGELQDDGSDSEEVPEELSELDENDDEPLSEGEAPVMVFRYHGTHDAAMKGLQTDASGGYDRSKL